MSKTALITGASSGIGKELAILFAEDKYNLVLVARRVDHLEKLSARLSDKFGIQATVVPVDLTEPKASENLFKEMENQNISVDVLVNNAGFGASGFFHEIDSKQQMDEINVNVVVLTELSRLFLPDMIKRGTGGVMNIASVAAFSAGPLMAVYYATKAFVLSLSTSLANELHGTGVTVTCVCPGPTKTEFQERAGVAQTWLFSNIMVMDAASVAKIAYMGFCNGELLVITGLQNKVLALAGKLAPPELSASVTRQLHH